MKRKLKWLAVVLAVSHPIARTGDMIHRILPFVSAIKPTRLGVLFAVLIGLGVGFWQWGRPPRPRVVLKDLGTFPHGHFSPNGRTLATVHMPEEDEFTVTLWDAESGQRKLELFADEERPRQVLFSPDGKNLACRFTSEIKVWDVASGRKLITYDQRYCPIVFSTDGRLHYLRDFVLHDVRDNKVVKELVQPGETTIGWGENAILVRGKEDRIRIWDLQAASVLAERKDIPIPWGVFHTANTRPRLWHEVQLSLDRRFLFVNHGLIFDLANGEKHELTSVPGSITFATMAPDGQTVAMEQWQPMWQPATPPNSCWSWFTNWLRFQSQPSQDTVILRAFPTGTEIMAIRDSRWPVFSPDGRTLLVSTGHNGGTLQLWDLPIRKPIGKILGPAGLAFVATLLAFNCLGWLQRRRMRLKANLVPNSVP